MSFVETLGRVAYKEEPTIWELRARVENKWMWLGAAGGAALGFGASFLGAEPLSELPTLSVLTEPLMRGCVTTVATLLGGIFGIGLGTSPIGRWRADVNYPLPREYPTFPTSEIFLGVDPSKY